MFATVVRQGASCARYRRLDRRHADILVQKFYSNATQQLTGIRCYATERVFRSLYRPLDKQDDRQTKILERRTWDTSTFSSHVASSPDTQSSFKCTNNDEDVLDAVKDAMRMSSSSLLDVNKSWTIVRSAIGSSRGYESMFLSPVDASLSSYNSNRSYNSFGHVGARSFSTSTQTGKANSKFATSAKIPTPKFPGGSMSPFGSIDPRAIVKGIIDGAWSLTKMIVRFLVRLPGNTWYYLTHPKERKEKIQELKDAAKKEFDHYWMGTKLLMADVRTARNLLGRTLSGSSLTRRERKQLLRTVSDLFRLVPFSMFILIPFMEFALPFALRLFPNMLPSTFQDSLKAEENMKRELQTRIAMAQFFQDTLEELAKEQKRIAAKRNSDSPENQIAVKQEQSAASMLEFLDRARKGEMIPPDVIVQYANYFQDDLTLDNMPRMQLINMCKYMSIPPYGSDSFLRFQLRHKIRGLKEDDQRILWEGIDSLTKMELREACQERGMRSTGLSKESYKQSLQQWLDLSVNKNVPISLLIMSRTFFLRDEMLTPDGGDEGKSVAGLADAISGLDKEVLNQVILEVATSEEKKSDPDVRKIKLEVLTHQNAMIREEREAAEKKKKASEQPDTPPPDQPVVSVELNMPVGDPKKFEEALQKRVAALDSVVVKVSELPGSSTSKETDILEGDEKAEEEEKAERDLSAEEMEAISQLISADPVSKEREELAKIKSAMKVKKEQISSQNIIQEPSEKAMQQDDIMIQVAEAIKKGDLGPASGDSYAAREVAETEKKATEEAKKGTVFSKEDLKVTPGKDVEEGPVAEEDESEEPHDPVIARLKKRIESMVDKIELQLSDVQVKIGDKLHFLDKDMDGILSREEMAECLQQVLKREITFDEAMEIASGMDENEDGVFTVQELIKWIETNKLVRLESEGRDADMDRVVLATQANEKEIDKIVKSGDETSSRAQQQNEKLSQKV